MFGIFLCTLTAISGDIEPRNAALDSLLDMSQASGMKSLLPAPTMPDGLDAAGQRAVIASLIKDQCSFESFTRKSVVAPQRLLIREVPSSNEAIQAYAVDVWFVAYDDKSTGWLSSAMKGLGTGKSITKQHLEKRGIAIPENRSEVFRHVELDFLGKFRLKSTVRLTWTRTPESVLLVGEADPRFAGDAEFPNQWQHLVREGDARRVGPAHDWDGAVFYLKMTKLAEPAGAMFIEAHMLFDEPMEWFGGANLLRSKLPHLIQHAVRSTRRDWAGGK
jgi:hypothetical protein